MVRKSSKKATTTTKRHERQKLNIVRARKRDRKRRRELEETMRRSFLNEPRRGALISQSVLAIPSVCEACQTLRSRRSLRSLARCARFPMLLSFPCMSGVFWGAGNESKREGMRKIMKESKQAARQQERKTRIKRIVCLFGCFCYRVGSIFV